MQSTGLFLRETLRLAQDPNTEHLGTSVWVSECVLILLFHNHTHTHTHTNTYTQSPTYTHNHTVTNTHAPRMPQL